MRSLSLLLLLTIGLFSCSSDDAVVLRYDGDNFSAPLLFAGEYTAAVRFPASDLSTHIGKQLVEIEFFMFSIPSNSRIQVFGEQTNSLPGTLIHDEDVTLRIDEGWNKIELNNPVNIDGSDLWVAVFVDHEVDRQSIGCDPGPAIQNGDFITDLDGEWTTLRAFSLEEISINWNIRAYLSE